MAVITLSRQLGSLGSEVARRAAENLGYRLMWRELINQAARRSGSPEAALADIDDLGLLNMCPSPAACRAYRQAVQQVIEELAQEGEVIIIGRAGQVLLKGRPEVLHVRVIAPIELRIKRISERQGIPLEAAKAQIEASDHSRARYLKRFYHARWDEPELYDLVINTTHLTIDEGASLICHALEEHLKLSRPIQSY